MLDNRIPVTGHPGQSRERQERGSSGQKTSRGYRDYNILYTRETKYTLINTTVMIMVMVILMVMIMVIVIVMVMVMVWYSIVLYRIGIVNHAMHLLMKFVSSVRFLLIFLLIVIRHERFTSQLLCKTCGNIYVASTITYLRQRFNNCTGVA